MPAAASVATAMALLAALALPTPAHAEPDADRLGRAQGYPVGGPPTWYQEAYRVGSWSAMDQTGLAVRVVPRAGPVAELPKMPSPPAIAYRYRNLGYTLDDYLERQRITGLLILKNGQIVAERYRYGRTSESRFLSFSMAKSVNALLVGIAADKGLLSLDAPAGQYAKDLAGSAYGDTTVRQLLRMSSGVKFTENYDGNDDIARLSRAMAGAGPRPVAVLRGLSERSHPAGEVFSYATAESEVLGRVVAGATGRNLSALTAEWLWQPLGAERDALWRVSVDGQEQAGGGFNATLRDWGRLGLLLANEGRVTQGGVTKQLVPEAFLLDATDPARQPAAFAPRRATPYFGYGYQFWTMPLAVRTFAMQGIHGQTVYVQPSSGIVMVQTAVYEQASGKQAPEPYAERNALWLGVLRSLGGTAN